MIRCVPCSAVPNGPHMHIPAHCRLFRGHKPTNRQLGPPPTATIHQSPLTTRLIIVGKEERGMRLPPGRHRWRRGPPWLAGTPVLQLVAQCRRPSAKCPGWGRLRRPCLLAEEDNSGGPIRLTLPSVMPLHLQRGGGSRTCPMATLTSPTPRAPPVVCGCGDPFDLGKAGRVR